MLNGTVMNNPMIKHKNPKMLIKPSKNPKKNRFQTLPLVIFQLFLIASTGPRFLSITR